jgi:hypothetical protein
VTDAQRPVVAEEMGPGRRSATVVRASIKPLEWNTSAPSSLLFEYALLPHSGVCAQSPGDDDRAFFFEADRILEGLDRWE